MSLKNQRQKGTHIISVPVKSLMALYDTERNAMISDRDETPDAGFFTAGAMRFMEQRSIYYKTFNANTAHNTTLIRPVLMISRGRTKGQTMRKMAILRILEMQPTWV